MGFRLSNCVNAVPAWIKDGKLYSDYGFLKGGVEVPVKIDFPKQCIQFDARNVMVYLRADNYEFILHEDDSGCMTKNGFLYQGFYIEDVPKTEYDCYTKGVVKDISISHEWSLVQNLRLDKDYILISGNNLPFTAVLSYRDNPELLAYRSDVLPMFIAELQKGTLMFDLNGCYKEVIGKVFSSERFKILKGFYEVGV